MRARIRTVEVGTDPTGGKEGAIAGLVETEPAKEGVPDVNPKGGTW